MTARRFFRPPSPRPHSQMEERKTEEEREGGGERWRRRREGGIEGGNGNVKEKERLVREGKCRREREREK